MDVNIIYKKMFDALTQSGIEVLLKAAYDIFGLPIAVADTAFKMLAPNYPPENQGFDIWDLPQKERRVPSEIIETFYTEDLLPKVIAHPHEAFYCDWGSMESTPCLTCAIIANNNVEGYIAISCPRERYRDWHNQAILIVANAIGVFLIKEQKTVRSSNTLISTFMQMLLSGSLSGTPELRKWEKILAISFSKYYVIVNVEAHSHSPQDLRAFFQQYFSTQVTNALSCIYDNSFVLLLYNIQKPDSLHALFAKIFTSASHLDITVGVSRVFDDPLAAPAHYAQATTALRVGKATQPGVYLHHYKSYLLEAFLAQILDSPYPSNYLHPAIPLLKLLDSENNTSYLFTLKTYTENMGNITITANNLHIHRNTLIYRLDKIQEYTQLDLLDQKNIVELTLGLHLDALLSQVEEA